MTEDYSPVDPIEVTALPRLGLSPGVLLAVFVGGAIGTVSRFLLDSFHPTASGHFPYATLIINLSGSLVIGLLIPVVETLHSRAPLARPFLVVGILGGWTTFSTLVVDADLLVRSGNLLVALGYLVATLIGGVLLVVVGDAAGSRLATSMETRSAAE